MPGISIHVVDVSRGVVAQGLAVRLERITPEGRVLLAAGRIGPTGLLRELDALAAQCTQGRYEAIFEVGDYYRQAGIALPAVPFLDTVVYGFGLDDPAQHYHLPFKMTPWGYSCFRGGA